MNTSLPEEFQLLLAALAEKPEHARVMWQYSIALVLIDDEKARVMRTRQGESGLHLILEAVAGEGFEVVRPEMSEDTEKLLMEQIREIADKGREE